MKKSTSEPGLSETLSNLILYKTNAFWICIKPAGMPVQADKTGDKSLLDLMEIYGHRTFFPVHRLDRPVSGLVILARTKSAAASLSRAFQEQEIEKIYLAVTAEKPNPPEGRLEHHIRSMEQQNKAILTDGTHPADRTAVLNYRCLASSDRYHLLEIKTEGGRFHQIRAQLAAIGCPIKGDVKYGARRGNKDRSIHLHAWKLSFKHPVSGEMLSFTAPLPADDPVWTALGAELEK
ncbi:MAG: RNA pseudouridine synthase [Saprospiraceae bacterium]|nr:RNA pseudouridine synthase [Saprospiraceae bacterium]